MKVTGDHWLEPAIRELLAGGSEMKIRRCLVIHFTSGATAKSSINYWRTKSAKGASAHIIIDRDGTVYQCRPFNRTCGHAGVSRWVDPNLDKKYTGLNSCSIGIELANAGDDSTLAKKWSPLPLVKLKHRNGDSGTWEQYPAAQYLACEHVAKVLCVRYKLDDITGHDCIAPERKNDPGPAFEMLRLRLACGFSGLPAIHKK